MLRGASGPKSSSSQTAVWSHLVADRLGDHQRGGRSKDEAVMIGRDRRLKQVERAGDIDVNESLGWETYDVRLVQRAGVNDRLDTVVREDALDVAPFCDRGNHPCVRTWRHILPDNIVSASLKFRCKGSSQPTR
jgi:hypothetical protein